MISPLLTRPPDPGELAQILDALAAKVYAHPTAKLSVLLQTAYGAVAMLPDRH